MKFIYYYKINANEILHNNIATEEHIYISLLKDIVNKNEKSFDENILNDIIEIIKLNTLDWSIQSIDTCLKKLQYKIYINTLSFDEYTYEYYLNEDFQDKPELIYSVCIDLIL